MSDTKNEVEAARTNLHQWVSRSLTLDAGDDRAAQGNANHLTHAIEMYVDCRINDILARLAKRARGI